MDLFLQMIEYMNKFLEVSRDEDHIIRYHTFLWLSD